MPDLGKNIKLGKKTPLTQIHTKRFYTKLILGFLYNRLE